MNWFDWMILGAVVVLWLRLEVLFHKHDVLRTEHERHLTNDGRHVNRGGEVVLSFHEYQHLSTLVSEHDCRLDKLDPPRRRATDKKDEPCHCGPTADGYVRISPGCPHWSARAEYGSVPKKKASKR